MIKTAVLGIGNILLRDDGIGVRVVQHLEKKGSLPGVELVDGGTSTMDMLGLFLTYDRVIVVDSLRGGHPPGTIYRLTPEQLGGYTSFNVSLHDVQVLDLTRISGMLGKSPEVTIIGIEPKEIKESLDLSPEMEAALPMLMELVEAEVASQTSGPRKRPK
jgi:hydrogenase maturation protease